MNQRLKNYTRFLQGLVNVGIDPQKWLLFFKVRRHTLVSPERLNNVYQLTEKVETKKRKGALVECGVWKGGCVAIMAAVLRDRNSNRPLWLFDSFEGLPEPTEKDGDKAKEYAGNKSQGKLEAIGKCEASLADVKDIFKQLNLPWSNVNVAKGWFQDTLPKVHQKIGPIALLRLDGDWYESTMICLDYLYDHVEPGGYIIFDDYYHWQGDNQAVKDFFKKRKLKPKLNRVDENAAWMKKT